MLSNGDKFLIGSTLLLVGEVVYILYAMQNKKSTEAFNTANSLCSTTDTYYKNCTQSCVMFNDKKKCEPPRDCTKVPTEVPSNACVIDLIGGNCMYKDQLQKSFYTKSNIVLTLSTYEKVYFSIFKRNVLEEGLLSIREQTLAVYREGINLIGYKVSLTKDGTVKLNIPYTITRISCPVGYSIFFELVETNNSSIKITPVMSGDTQLPEPVVVNPSIYKSITMRIIPS